MQYLVTSKGSRTRLCIFYLLPTYDKLGQVFNDGIEALRISYKKMNPFCIPFSTTNMGSAMLAMDLVSLEEVLESPDRFLKPCSHI